MQTEPVQHSKVPPTEGEKDAIRQQLDRLLLDPAFKNSKRYPSFLRFVVSQALEGETDSLKERVLGVEIFGRPADYDSTQDPIVRVTAAGIRKRIVKYYEDPEHRGEIRLLLPSGSYVPHFEFPDAETISLPHVEASALEPGVAPHIPAEPGTIDFARTAPRAVASPPEAAQRSGIGKAAWMGIAAVLLLAVGVAVWRTGRTSLVDAFWAPVVESSKPVLLCVADQSRYAAVAAATSSDADRENQRSLAPTLMAAEDTLPLLDFINIVRPKARSLKVQVQGQTNFSDLGHGPTILIGAFDNKWTLFVTDPLRFHFASTQDESLVWIEDRQSPAKRDWLVASASANQNVPRKDYALVARFVDPNTKQITLVVAGLGHHGTLAAGDFVVSASALKDLENRYPKIWKSRNFEIVLETLIVNGHAGPANVDAVHTW